MRRWEQEEKKRYATKERDRVGGEEGLRLHGCSTKREGEGGELTFSEREREGGREGGRERERQRERGREGGRERERERERERGREGGRERDRETERERGLKQTDNTRDEQQTERRRQRTKQISINSSAPNLPPSCSRPELATSGQDMPFTNAPDHP